MRYCGGNIKKEESERRAKLFEQGIRVCSKCKEEKPIDSFYKNNRRKWGYQNSCKKCTQEYNKKNKEKRREYREANKESIKEYRKKYYEANKESIKEYRKKHRQENKEQQKEYLKEYREKRRQQDPVYKLRCDVSRTITEALHRKNGSKYGQSVEDHLPYTFEQLKTHIEAQWSEGMSWDNHTRDGWHIDHIIPQSKLPYDSMSHPNFIKCWSLDNLQPLWAEENMRKGAKLLENNDL